MKRFWDNVDTESDCWLWTAGCFSNGYGCFWNGTRNVLAHRVAWELENGPIPEDMQVLHHCDVKPCQNPIHLFLGTPLDNMRDRDQKGRHGNKKKTHCKRGHPFDEVNTYYYADGKRECRPCRVYRR
ncbi:hypothetical protein LCGC14_3010540 [marine sediment metagenome]|uniref:HNH nuclease domain-containing protein n=1 Tax=marine sediment metagenome TaxID=412755 RepID=A0A0F8ZPG8_9ZZZZ